MAERRATGAKSNTEGRKRKSRSAKKADEAVTREAPPSAPPSKKHGTLWVGLALAMVIVGAVLYGLWPVILGEREARFLGLETEAPALPPTESPSTESPTVAPDAVESDAVESDAVEAAATGAVTEQENARLRVEVGA
ncbi:MAG: hypothetical protein O7A65_08660, partial [Proteobacteria bacterium]|nr:hypothetical protein [Pseudomonadota bacterium]